MIAKITVIAILMSSVASFRAIVEAQQQWDDNKNRDGKSPTFPLVEDFRRQTEHIVKAHEVLRSALQQFLGYRDANLTVYLNRMIRRSDPFEDENGVVIPAYKKVFRFILVQRNEIVQNNYAAGQFVKDKLDLCSVARFLSHQPTVEGRKSLMKRMGEALGYKCHPCTPYKRRESGAVEVPDTSDLDINYDDPVQCNNVYNNSTLPMTTTTDATYSSPQTITNPLPITTTTDAIYSPVQTSPRPWSEITGDNHHPCEEFFYEESDANVTFTGTTLVCRNIPLNEVKKRFHQQIECLTNQRSISTTKLKVDKDPFAFLNGRVATRAFRINYCDLSDLDLGFLAGFNNLEELVFHLTPNSHRSFRTLPPLPALSSLDISDVSSAFDGLVVFPELSKGLETFKLKNITSEKATDFVHEVMNWLALSSKDTLKNLVIFGVSTSEIPAQLSSFGRLVNLTIEGARLPLIRSNASISAPVHTLSLLDNGISHIEPGAFQGDFSKVTVLLNRNNLTRFEADVFRPMLRQMQEGTGALAVNANPFDCESDPCHLAWLLRDDRHLLDHLQHAMCITKNGVETSFTKVEESVFDNCPCTDCAILTMS